MPEAAKETMKPAADFPRRFGRFVLLGTLGSGGMGKVFRAWLEGPDSFRKLVAVKVLAPKKRQPENEDIIRASIRNEARIGALLRHPGVVEVYDYGIEAGLPWISMELVEGADLERLLKVGRTLPPAALLDLGLQVCSALDYAHDFSDGEVKVHLVHRDLKPANIIVDRFGRARITDFGIARSTLATGATTASGLMKGTPTFMAPEQILSKHVDARTDIFALGAILFEAATGERLLRRDGVAATVAAVLAVDEITATPAFEKVNQCIPGLARVLRRCLAKDPDGRYPTATALGEDLLGLMLAQPALVGGSRDGLAAVVARAEAAQPGGPPAPSLMVEPSDVMARTPTDVLLARYGLDRPGANEPQQLADRTPSSGVVRRGPQTLSERWARPRNRALMLLVAGAALAGVGMSGGLLWPEADEAAPVVAAPEEEPTFTPVGWDEGEPLPEPAPVVARATPRPPAMIPARPPKEPTPAVDQPSNVLAEARPVEAGAAVAAVPSPTTITRTVAVHRRLVQRAHAGTSRSFIVEAQGLDIDHVRLFLRHGEDEPWEHRVLTEVASGYWGAVVPIEERMAGVAAYRFEVKPSDGPAYSVNDDGAPWTFEVSVSP